MRLESDSRIAVPAMSTAKQAWRADGKLDCTSHWNHHKKPQQERI